MACEWSPFVIDRSAKSARVRILIMPKNKSCGYSVTHVTCGTIKFVLEHLGHLYYALQRMTFSGTASLVLR